MLNEKNLYYIGSIRHSHPNPIQHLNIVLFDATTRLEILEKKLSILKSFSPIPVALLILNNLPQDLIFSPDIKSFVLQNQLNIGLLVILGIYTYHLFSTFSAQKQIITHISKIKKELYLLSSQDSELSISNSRNSLLDFIQFPPFTHISTLAAYRISVRAIMLRVFIPHVFSFFCGCILLLTG